MTTLTSLIVSIVQIIVGVAFIVYGNLVAKNLKRGKMSALIPRIFKVSVFCALFFICSSALLIITTVFSEFYNQHFELMDSIYHFVNLANLWTLIYFFNISIVNGKRSYITKNAPNSQSNLKESNNKASSSLGNKAISNNKPMIIDPSFVINNRPRRDNNIARRNTLSMQCYGNVGRRNTLSMQSYGNVERRNTLCMQSYKK